MHTEKHRLYSRHLGGGMPVSVYGHFGVPLLFFPTASSDHEELERAGMIAALAPHLQAGRVKIFTCDSLNALSWLNAGIPPAERAWRQELYDRFVVDELAPFIRAHCRDPHQPIATAGASFGAYHAVNSLFRHPDVFRWCIGMSGIYDVSRYFEGYFDHRCYYQNPVMYMSRLEDPVLLGELARCSINLVCGQGAWERVEWSRQLHSVLQARGVPHRWDLWGHDVSHDWPWWKLQMDVYLGRLFG